MNELHRLSLRSFDFVTPELKENITSYYADLNAPFATKKSKGEWKTTLRELDGLKSASVMRAALPSSPK